jgi:hypothetical protein
MVSGHGCGAKGVSRDPERRVAACSSHQAQPAARWLRWTGTLAALLAILLASGTHWVALQAVAFGTMIVRYAQDVPWSQAIANTFDGQHPCPLCHAVQEGRQQEEKQRPLLDLEQRSELAVPPATLQAVARSTTSLELPALRLTPWRSVSYPPPKPRPRPA